MSRETDRSGAAALAKDIVRAAVVDLTGRAIAAVVFLAVGAIAVLVSKGGSVPAWVAVLAVVATAGVVALAGRSRRRALLESHGELDEEAELYSWMTFRHEAYSRHVAQALDVLQRVAAADIGVSIPDYIEKGILAPARDVLLEKPIEQPRLSVLLPDPQSPDHWKMVWAAGHSVTGKAKYAERITDTVSRYAYETGEPQHWEDTRTDSGFRQNPQASYPTLSMMSLPIKRGDDVVGVFNVVSAEPHAFDYAEETYLTALGAVMAVAVAVGLNMDASQRSE